jgi:tartrate dehydratase alpha subunit/fumarate hydratase class I-like protein
MFTVVSSNRSKVVRAVDAAKAIKAANVIKAVRASPVSLCAQCLITKSVVHRDNLVGVPFINVSSDTTNEILFNILIHGIGSVNSSTTVLSSGSRYRVTVLSKNRKSCLLLQQYLHMDISQRRSRLQPVSFRYVSIIF